MQTRSVPSDYLRGLKPRKFVRFMLHRPILLALLLVITSVYFSHYYTSSTSHQRTTQLSTSATIDQPADSTSLLFLALIGLAGLALSETRTSAKERS